MQAVAELPKQPSLSELAVDMAAVGPSPHAATMLRSGGLRLTLPARIMHSRWFDSAMARFEAVLALPPHWDSYSAVPMTQFSVQRALYFLLSVLEPDSSPPNVVPLADGGVQLVWHQNGLDLEATFGGAGEAELYLRDLDGETELELDPLVESSRQHVRQFIDRLHSDG